jgi:hypothetical protein
LKKPPYIMKNMTSRTMQNYYRTPPKQITRFTNNTGISRNAHEEFVKIIEHTYNKKQIPIGTRIYRTAMESDPRDFFKTNLLFFGLDAWISIWYALEMWQKFKKTRHEISYNKWHVYFHEYEVMKPIKYTFLPDILTNPKNEEYYEICKTQPCVHPQVIFRSSNNPLEEIGTELTFPYDYPILEYINPVKTQKINIIKLMEMQFLLSDMLDFSDILYYD